MTGKKTQKSFTYTRVQRQAMTMLNGRAGNIMLYGGSRSGKTFVICSNIVLVAMKFPGIRIAILRRYLKDVRESILLDTFPKVLELRLGMDRATFEKMLNKSNLFFRTDEGSEIWFGGLDDSDRVEKILGKEYGLIYFNEVSQIPHQSVEIARTRLAMKVDGWRNKCYYDCNPTTRSHWVYRTFVEKLAGDRTPLLFPEDYVSLQMNPKDNASNISSEYLNKTLEAMKGNLRERFLEGRWTDDRETALWKRTSMIDPYRITAAPPELERIVVGVDPAVTSSERSDLTGIVVAGKKAYRGKYHYYILDDASLPGTPVEWARRVVHALRQYNADRIVAEVNQGGDLVVSMLRNIDETVPVRTVHATRGKIVRAEPIAALYEQGLVHHVGELLELENEMISYTGLDSEQSPDRMDALVWALTDLTKNSTTEIGRFSFV
ncbi:MAG: phage terminase large subunit [Thermoguttaceae bacterium]|nr:phage terminase large subunit [Thermoguttaceae bacterium]